MHNSHVIIHDIHIDMKPIDRLYSDIEVLSKSVAYLNLSAASLHVGLSQPQLSRIIKKIEDTLSVVLLERGSKRKSAWTPTAHKLAEVFSKTSNEFSRSIDQIVSPGQSHKIKIGTLEGLSDLGLKLCAHLLTNNTVDKAELNIYDLNELEEFFLKGSYDMIFTAREPTQQKFRYHKILGYQTHDPIASKDIQVMSPFEFHTAKKKTLKKDEVSPQYFISNSLSLRKRWFQNYGGTGIIPSEVKKLGAHKEKVVMPVIFLGAETLSPLFWTECEKYFDSQ